MTLRGICIALAALASAGAPARAQSDSLTVEEAVAEALRNNLRLIAERANIPIAEARILSARLRPNPVVSVGADYLDALGTGFNEENAGGPPEYTVRTDFVIERGAKRQARVEVAERTRSVVELQFLDAMRLLALEVRNAAVDVLLAKDNLAVAGENYAAANRIVEINTERLRAGDIAEVELMRSRVAALEAANAVRRAELNLRLAQNRLRPMLGRSMTGPAVDITGEMRRDAPVTEATELAREAVQSRPDLQALRRDLERASSELQLQQAQAKVNYVVGSQYRRQQGLNGKNNSLGFFLSAELPAFNRNQGEIERARQELRQGEARLRAMEADIRVEVQGAYEQWLAARDLLESVEKKMLPDAREVRDVTEYSYRRGEATLLELLDAQRAFNETRQALNEARAEYARSLYLLEAVTGREVRP